MLKIPVLSVAAVTFAALASAQNGLMPLEQQKTLVAKYCVGCHNDKLKSGGFNWSQIDLAHPDQKAETVEKAIRKLRAGMMPPSGLPRPDAATMKNFAASLENSIDKAALVRPTAGTPDLHRLNRTEYRNSVRDLLGLDVDVTTVLPPDDMSHGFDNMADALTITPALMQGYIRAASKIARDAIGDPQATPVMTSYNVPKVVNQMRHIDGTPFGTRGGVSVVHNFPADGSYVFKLKLYYNYLEELVGQTLSPNLKDQQIEVSVDGARVAVFTINPLTPETKANFDSEPVKITAGPHRLSAAFLARFDGPVEDQFRNVEQDLVDISAQVPGLTILPHLRTMSVTGPMQVAGLSDTPSRRKIFSCRPVAGDDEVACAKKIISALGRQAYRHPLNDAETEELLNHYQEGRNGGNFETGIRMVVQSILADPQFVFRFERMPTGIAPGRNYRVTDLELASRLSYFLWSSAPDEELITLASQNKLHETATLEKEVRRMLASPKASALGDNFAWQWLHLQNLKEMDPDGMIFPNFSRNLAQSMQTETKMLFDSIVREDRNVTDMLTANYTYVDELLAKHYGIPDVYGSTFRRVEIKDPNRYGILGHASFLTLTSQANRTSLVQRGKYVMEVLMGTPPPTPPPNVPPLKENVRNEKPLSVRERQEQHRTQEPCHSCHQMMDPIGMALDNFDAVGQWRTVDSGFKIDPSGMFFDGTKLDGPVSVRNAVLGHPESYINNFTQNLLAYAVGRVLDYTDMPTVRSIWHDAAKSNNRFSAFVLGIVKNTPFQMRTAEEPEAATAAVAQQQ